MSLIQPPPTYAELVIIDPHTKKAQFNPVWLNWFLGLTQTLQAKVGTDSNTFTGVTTFTGDIQAASLFYLGDTTTPAGLTQLGGMFSTNTAGGANLLVRKSTASTQPADLYGLKSRGTNAAPTVVASGDSLFRLVALGYDGTNYLTSSGITFVAEGTVSSGIVPGRMIFATTNASGAATTALAIDSAQNVLVTAPSGLGYGTGAGGTVTQATSKSTSVTLNKPTGQITMNNAALAAGASVQFTLNDSLISSADILDVMVNWNGNYSARCVATGAGSAAIILKNESGGSLSEAVILNFQLHKGAIA